MIKLVAFDMDGTLVDISSSFAFVHAHFKDSNEGALARFNAGEIDDEEFIRSDVRIWKKHHPDLALQDLERILDAAPLMPGARALFDRLESAHLQTVIISGGIDLLADRIAHELDIDRALANGFVTDASGRLTGDGIIRVPIREKERVLAELQGSLGISPDETASVGNSEIDVGLFNRSRIGIAFHPADDVVRAHATTIIERGDLTEVETALTDRERLRS